MDVTDNEPQPVAWWARNTVIGVGLAVFAVFWIRIAKLEPGRILGDFGLHWEFGRRLVTGEFLYEGGHDVPYPPFWALMHAPLSFMSVKTAQIIAYPMFLAALAGLLFVLRSLTREHFTLNSKGVFWTSTLAVLLTARYLIRDLPEVGVNLMLVAMSWATIWLWTRRRDWPGGLLLGLAISLKCTPALFWAWFILKRQWKIAGITAAATIVFSLSPVLVQGPQMFARCGDYWLTHALRGVTTNDPSVGVFGPLQLQNMSLKNTLARFLMELPRDHPGRAEHPLYVDVLTLEAGTANQVIRCVLIALVVGFAFQFRQRIDDRRDPLLLNEWASVSILILLLSPITWGQHCVGVLPAMYLLFAKRMTGQTFDVPIRWWLAAWSVFVLALFGDAVGRDASQLLQSYHLETWCIIGLLAITLRYYRQSRGLSRTLTGHQEEAGLSLPASRHAA